MITHFLGTEEVDGYARDIAERLELLGSDFPLVWCPLGKSGDKLSRRIAAALPLQRRKQIQVVPVFYNKKEKTVTVTDQDASVASIRSAAAVFLLDSSIHSGASMLAVMNELRALGAQRVVTYSLVVKQSTHFVPHFFGVLVGEHDRTLFLLPSIPNNRLFKPSVAPSGVLRSICANDCLRQSRALDTGVASLDKITWGDLWYEKQAHGYEVYVMEVDGEIAAYVKIKLNSKTMLIDTFAADKQHQGHGYGAALLRWSESLARAANCAAIELWAIANKVPMYRHLRFVETGREVMDLGDNERYHHMRRELLYTFDLEQLTHE